MAFPFLPVRSSATARIRGFLARSAAIGAFVSWVVPLSAQSLANPGFESDLTDWSQKADYGMSRAVAEAARTGALGLRITDDKPDKASNLESLAMEAEAGKKYEVSFWLKTVSGDGGVQVAMRFFDEAGKPLQKKAPSIVAGPAAEWKRYSFIAPAPAGTVGLTVVIHSVASGVTTADLDDFACQEVPQP